MKKKSMKTSMTKKTRIYLQMMKILEKMNNMMITTMKTITLRALKIITTNNSSKTWKKMLKKILDNKLNSRQDKIRKSRINLTRQEFCQLIIKLWINKMKIWHKIQLKMVRKKKTMNGRHIQMMKNMNGRQIQMKKVISEVL